MRRERVRGDGWVSGTDRVGVGQAGWCWRRYGAQLRASGVLQVGAYCSTIAWPLWSCLRHELQWQIGRWSGGGEHNRCNASWPMKANRVKITPSAPAISDCSQELSRRISPITASLNAVSKPAKRNRTNARGPCSPRLRSACQRQAGVWGHSVALGACRRRSGADPTTGARARCRRPPWPSRQGSGPR